MGGCCSSSSDPTRDHHESALKEEPTPPQDGEHESSEEILDTDNELDKGEVQAPEDPEPMPSAPQESSHEPSQLTPGEAYNSHHAARGVSPGSTPAPQWYPVPPSLPPPPVVIPASPTTPSLYTPSAFVMSPEVSERVSNSVKNEPKATKRLERILSSSTSETSSTSSLPRRRRKNLKKKNKKSIKSKRTGKHSRRSSTPSSSSSSSSLLKDVPQRCKSGDRPPVQGCNASRPEELYELYDEQSMDGSATIDLNSALFYTPRSAATLACSGHRKGPRSVMTVTQTRNNTTTPVSADRMAFSRQPSDASRFPFDTEEDRSFYSCVSDRSSDYPKREAKSVPLPTARLPSSSRRPEQSVPPPPMSKLLRGTRPPLPLSGQQRRTVMGLVPVPGLVTGGPPVYANSRATSRATIDFSQVSSQRDGTSGATAFYSCQSHYERDSTFGFDLLETPASTVNGMLPSEMFYSIPSSPVSLAPISDLEPEPDYPASRYSSSLASSVWLENDVHVPPAMVVTNPSSGPYRSSVPQGRRNAASQRREHEAMLQQTRSSAARGPHHQSSPGAVPPAPPSILKKTSSHTDPSINPTFRGANSPELYLITPRSDELVDEATPRKGPKVPLPVPRPSSSQQSVPTLPLYARPHAEVLGLDPYLDTPAPRMRVPLGSVASSDTTPEIIRIEELRANEFYQHLSSGSSRPLQYSSAREPSKRSSASPRREYEIEISSDELHSS